MAGTARLRGMWRPPRGPRAGQGLQGGRDASACRLEGCDGAEDTTHHLVTCGNAGHRSLYLQMCSELQIQASTNRPDRIAAQILAFQFGSEDTPVSTKQAIILEYLHKLQLLRFKSGTDD